MKAKLIVMKIVCILLMLILTMFQINDNLLAYQIIVHKLLKPHKYI